MTRLQKNNLIFYLKPFLWSFGTSAVVYSFMLFQFWWGNHDWEHIKEGMNFSSGLYEIRFSQHLPTVVLLDGHILPIIVMLISFALMTIQAALMAKYLDIPQNFKSYMIFILFMVLNPYLFVFYYYVYIALPLSFWGMCVVALLYITEKSENKKYWFWGVTGYFLILGSYPPNMALAFTLFMAKRCINYVHRQENIRKIIKKGLIFLSQLLIAYLGFSVVRKCLISTDLVNTGMYNLAINTPQEIAHQLPKELFQSISQLFHPYTFLDAAYCILLAFIFMVALIITYKKAQNKLIYIILVLGLCVATRYAFILSARPDMAIVRLEYWGRLGLYAFALSILLRQNKQWMKNLVLLWAIIILSLFIKTDFEIQKVQYLGFAAGKKHQSRIQENILIHPAFELKPKYISYTFGAIPFREKYYQDFYHTPEMTSYAIYHIFGIISNLFWEEVVNPTIIEVGIEGQNIWRIGAKQTNKWYDREYWLNNPKNMKNIRFWLYHDAKYNSVYVDDKYIIMVLDLPKFYKNREILASRLDQK